MISVDNVSFGYGEAQETHLPGQRRHRAGGVCPAVRGLRPAGKTTVTKLINGLIPAFTPGCRLEGRVEVDGLDPGTTPMYELAGKLAPYSRTRNPSFLIWTRTANWPLGWKTRVGRRRRSGSGWRIPWMRCTSRNCKRGTFSPYPADRSSCLLSAPSTPWGRRFLCWTNPRPIWTRMPLPGSTTRSAGLKRQGRTVVIAEHRLYFLTDLIDRVLYLRDGVLERTFTRKQFCALTDREREALGLRTLIPAGCTLPAAAPAGAKEGLSVEGLTCAYRKEPPVFQALSFSARPGEVVAITGPNGVGKTTLSRCLCGLIREQAGQIVLNGRPLNRKEQQKAAFCVMQDVNHQLFSDSVWGECRMSAPDVPDSSLKGVLDSLHLLPFRERHPMSLSGGQKQRLAVATALLSEKPILIFDEPTSGLDYARMVEVSGVIRSLAQQGRIVLVVTHDQEFLQRACDRVLRL